MVIRHNISELNSDRWNKKADSSLMKSLEKLSSGLEINRAADDAAGLAVSEKMRSQIAGMKQSVRNCSDGISLIQTFEGALGETVNIIKRMKTLAVQSANGTYCDDVDRVAIDVEFGELRDEIGHISDTDFNRVCMLNGGVQQHCPIVGYTWDPPKELDWVSGSFVNNTDNSGFTMSIKKLPALDDMTVPDSDQMNAISEFAHSVIGVTMDNGRARLYFQEPDPALNLSIKMSGYNKGIVYANSAKGSAAIAEVTLSGIEKTVIPGEVTEVPVYSTTATSTGTGRWSTSCGYVSYTYPTSNVSGIAMQNLSSSYVKNSDEYDDDPATNRNQALRTEYHDWIKSLPTDVQFKITDDRKHFTIVGNADYFTLSDGTACDNKTEYDIGTTFTMATNNKNCNTSGVDYTWNDAKIAINWNVNTVKPGGTISMSSNSCTGSSSLSKSDSYYHSGYETYSYTTLNEKSYYVYYYLKLDSISSGCTSSGTSDFGGDSEEHGFWLEHGTYKFQMTYDQKAAEGEKWSVHVSNDYGESKDYTEGSDAFKTIVSKFGLQTNAVAAKIENAHAVGYFANESSLGADAYHFSVPSNGKYTFTFSFSGPQTSYYSSSAWSSSSTNYDLKLGEYNPDNPASGGIDYDKAAAGTYTYKNDDMVNTLQAGYWVDSSGNQVNLEDVGIYLPSAYNHETLPSSDYDSYNKPLHDGMTITVSVKKEQTGTAEVTGDPTIEISGPTGNACAEVDLDDELDPVTEADPTLTFAEDLTLQVNSRSKDAVRFTFDYSTDGIGDLKCDLNCTAEGLGIDRLDLLTQDSSNYAIDRLDYALNKVTMIRDSFGAAQNRLEHKIDNLNSTNENLNSAESRIRDTDMAEEMMKLVKEQIISQSSQTMIVQAETLPQSALSLIGSQSE